MASPDVPDASDPPVEDEAPQASVRADAAALLAYGLLLATCLSWAGNSIAGRMAAGEVSPMVLTMLRWTLAVAIALPFAWPHLRRERALVAANWKQLALLGMTGFTLFNVLLYTALSKTTAVNVVLVQAATPALICIINFALFRTRVVVLQAIGFAVSVAGVSLIVLSGGGGFGAIGAGELFIVAGVCVYACYTVAVAFKPAVHWLTSITVMGGFALLAAVPFAGWEMLSGTANWPGNGRDWGVVLFTALFPSLVAQICYMRSIELIGSNRAGLFMNLVPVLGTIMAVVILDEAFGWHHALALTLAVGGVAMAEWGARRRAPGAG